jgi:hypothetical protein
VGAVPLLAGGGAADRRNRGENFRRGGAGAGRSRISGRGDGVRSAYIRRGCVVRPSRPGALGAHPGRRRNRPGATPARGATLRRRVERRPGDAGRAAPPTASLVALAAGELSHLPAAISTWRTCSSWRRTASRRKALTCASLATSITASLRRVYREAGLEVDARRRCWPRCLPSPRISWTTRPRVKGSASLRSGSSSALRLRTTSPARWSRWLS